MQKFAPLKASQQLNFSILLDCLPAQFVAVVVPLQPQLGRVLHLGARRVNLGNSNFLCTFVFSFPYVKMLCFVTFQVSAYFNRLVRAARPVKANCLVYEAAREISKIQINDGIL